MAISRNVEIDIIHERKESADPNNDTNDNTNSFREKILSDYYGEIVVGYVIGLL